jgi:hypothetical protein
MPDLRGIGLDPELASVANAKQAIAACGFR